MIECVFVDPHLFQESFFHSFIFSFLHLENMSNLFDRMKLFVQRDKEFRSALYDIMGFYPHNVEFYRIAFAHKSHEYKSKKTGDRPLNNERLEFLGDAVLETVVSDIVYHNFKNKREGFLTNTRSKIVSRESLGKLAKDLGIDRLIQSHTNSKAHNSFLAGNAFEALMGAIYLDRGFDYAFRFIEHRIMGTVLDLEGVAHKEVNFKSKLLEWSQKNRIRIDFKDKQLSNGDSNTPSFSTTIILEGLFAGDGKGFSKKEAHQSASKDALLRMRREPKFIDEVFTSKEKRTAMEADPCFVLPVIDEIEADLAREVAEKSQKAEQRREQRNEKSKQRKERKALAKKEQPAAEKPATEKPAAAKPAVPVAEKSQNSAAEKPQSPAPETSKVPAAESQEVPVAEPVKEEKPAAKTEQKKVEQKVVPIAMEMVESDEKKPDFEVVVNTPKGESQPAETDVTPEVQHAKKSRRRGKRQNAAGFTNTEIVPAETSHRAEKAAKKVEEAKKEKARKNAKKTAKAAAKGIEPDAVETPASDSKEVSPAIPKNTKNSEKAKPQTAEGAPKATKKPRRRRKPQSDMPSETPNPEREQAISAAEEAAYKQSNTEE